MVDGLLTRRQLIAASSLITAGVVAETRHLLGDDATTAVAADDAISRLKQGNRRFVEGRPRHRHSSHEWRQSLVSGQHPFAVVLSCADSRVPTELVFDQGCGDLFVIRNAGNVMMDDVMGSIEYALLHLNTKLVVVMGHEGCGAVTAALKSREERAKEPKELQQVLRLIDPAIKRIDPRKEDAVGQGVEANVRWTVERCEHMKKERDPQRTKAIAVVGAIYELRSGRVRFLTD